MTKLNAATSHTAANATSRTMSQRGIYPSEILTLIELVPAHGTPAIAPM